MQWFNPEKPLWLPTGTVRSIIALVFVLAAIVAMFALGAGVPEWFALLLGVIVRDYFAHRDAADSESE